MNSIKSISESAELRRFMADGKPDTENRKFICRKNQVIFDCLKHLKGQIGYFANSEAQLIRFMEEYGYIREAGGRKYIRKVFKGYAHPVTGLLWAGTGVRGLKNYICEMLYRAFFYNGRGSYEQV